MKIPQHTRVLLVADDERRTREFGINRPMVIGLLILALMTVFLAAAILIAFAMQTREVAALRRDTRELSEARRQVAQVADLRRELDEIRRFQGRLLTMLGVERPNAANDSLGVVLAAAASGGSEVGEETGAPGGAPDGMAGGANDGTRGGANDATAGDSATSAAAGADEFVATAVNLRRAAATVLEPPPDLWPTRGYVTRGFIEGQPARGVLPHPGIDIAGPRDASIVAAASGTVYRTGEDPFLGNFVEIQHGLRYLTVYGHCSRILVARGDRVQRGQVVAYLGDTGEASAPHLHFEIWRDGEAVDPREYLAGEPPRQ